jgi:hypothetical protein
LAELPKLEAALAGATLHFSAVRELTRVATPETERAWINAAAGKTSREVEEMAAGRQAGDLPSDPPRPEARRHRITLEVSAETYATFRAAQAHLRRDHGERLSEDEMLMLMSRTVLGGPADPGTSSYQIQMTQCRSCGRASQDGGGIEIPVEAAVAELAGCDAQRLRPGARAAQDLPPATRREVVRRHHDRCAVSGCRHATWTDVHHVTPRAECGSHDPDGLVLLCSVHHAARPPRRAHHRRHVLDGVPLPPRGWQPVPRVELVRPRVGASVELADAVRASSLAPCPAHGGPASDGAGCGACRARAPRR